MTKLLNIDANAKTVKGQKRGYMTAVLYLAPFKSAGVNVCPMAELAGCWRGCLNTAGRGGISKGSAKMNPHGIELPDNAIQNARIKRTRFYADDRDAFMLQLDKGKGQALLQQCGEAGRHPGPSRAMGPKIGNWPSTWPWARSPTCAAWLCRA